MTFFCKICVSVDEEISYFRTLRGFVGEVISAENFTTFRDSLVEV